MEKSQWDIDPDAIHHRWSNYCMYCKTTDYTPFSSQLLHYCINCGLICEECGFPKPLLAFPYDYASDEYNKWRSSFGSSHAKGRPPRDAHMKICNHCHGRHLDEADAMLREQERLASRAAVDNPAARAAMEIMLKGKS